MTEQEHKLSYFRQPHNDDVPEDFCFPALMTGLIIGTINGLLWAGFTYWLVKR